MRLSTLRQQAYEQIRAKLVAGDMPPGQPLSELGLAKELGMSRTPVREALRQMEIEGLLEYAPHFGAVVRRLDRRELEEMYAVREVLEAFAAAEAARRITPEQIARLETLCRRMRRLALGVAKSPPATLSGEPLRQFLAADMEFHRLILRAAGNRFMSKVLDTTHLLERVFRSTDWVYDRRGLAEANRFHWRVLRSIAARDAEGARCWTAAAMRVSRTNALARFPAHAEGALPEGEDS